jgi:hypothetical protein
MWCPCKPTKCEKTALHSILKMNLAVSFETVAIAGSLLSIRSVFVKYNVSYHQYCGKSAT